MSDCSEKLDTMPLTSHLLELRKRVVYIFLGMVLCLIVLFPFMSTLFNYVSEPLLAVLPKDTQLLSVSVIAPVMGPLKVLFFSAFSLCFPFIIYQIWAFVSPGLYKKEKKIVVPVVLSSMLMFCCGVAYCYYVVFDFLFQFISKFSPESVSFAPDIDSYISFVLHMFIAFGITFEVPVIVFILRAIRITSLEKLKKFRKFLIVIAFAVAAVFTPPDVASQLLLALPIIVLYEIGLLISSIFIRDKR